MNRKADVRYEESDFKHIPHEGIDLSIYFKKSNFSFKKKNKALDLLKKML
jgi:hypothetical protein